MNTIIVNEISECDEPDMIQVRLNVGNESNKTYSLKNIEFKTETRVLFDMDEDMLFTLLKIGDRRFANQGFYFTSFSKLLCTWRFEKQSVQFPVDLSNPEYCGPLPKRSEVYLKRFMHVWSQIFKIKDNHTRQ